MEWADKRPLSAPKLPAHQELVDQAQAEIRADLLAGRRSLFKPSPEGPGRTENVLDQRIAEELDLLIRHLGQIGDVLSDDPILLSRHAAQLQSIDLLQQVLGNLGRIIVSANKSMAVERLTMSDLKARLERRALRPIAD